MKLTTQLAAQICTFLAIAYLVEPFMSLFSGDNYWFAIKLILGIFTAVPILLCGIGLRRSIAPAWWAMVLISAGGTIFGLAYAIGGSNCRRW
jgi:glucan phosphoethanolaminetransferase (alkaline phosphatase superfamily)